MAGNFEIINSQVIFAYQRSLDIRKRQFEFEEKLKDIFNIPFRNFAIGDDQDGNIPRFEGISKHGFSKLQTTQFSTNLITNFKDDYSADIKKVGAYLSERISLLKGLVKSENNKFSAFVIELGFEFGSDAEINKILKENTGAHCLTIDTNDFSLSYSQKYKDDYFLNIKISKYTEGKFKIVDSELVPDGSEQKKGISIILDINSKLAFRNNKDYGVDIVDSLEKETFQILSTYTLEDYLKGNIK